MATIERADVSSATASRVMGAGHARFFCYVLHLPTAFHPRYQTRHDSFVAFGLRAAQSHNIAVGRYVIMLDHVHLFVCGDLHFHLGKWIKALKQPLGKSISSGMRHDRICQEGFSIIFYAVTKAWCRNGNMCAIIPSAPDSLQFGRSGRFRGKLC